MRVRSPIWVLQEVLRGVVAGEEVDLGATRTQLLGIRDQLVAHGRAVGQDLLPYIDPYLEVLDVLEAEGPVPCVAAVLRRTSGTVRRNDLAPVEHAERMTIAEPASEFVDAEVVAKALRITARQVRQLAKEGGLPAIRVGRVYRFDPEAIGRAVSIGEDQALRVARAIRSAAHSAEEAS